MIKVADIFCGAGGLSYGFASSNKFEILFANDIDKDAINSYKINHKNTETICKDIANLDKKLLQNFDIDLLLGGPPCQSYSTLGKRQMDDRANLFKQYLRILDILRPKMFIFENVTGLLSMQKGTLFKYIKSEFKQLGYDIKHKILNSADYGVPQIRERIFIVGSTVNIDKFNFPKKNTNQFISIKEALSDLPNIKSGENGNHKGYDFSIKNNFLNFIRDTKNLSEHESPNNSTHLIKIMQTLKDGQTKDDLPDDIKPKSGYGNTYAKMWWDKPAPTITRNFSTPSSSRCIHPRDSRALTIREGARLQSFPDSYKFSGSATSKRLQIGNAVPPLLSIALAKEVVKFFNEEK